MSSPDRQSADVYRAEQQKIEGQLARAWAGWNEEELDYLRGHFLAVLSTTRASGPPQTSMTAYALDEATGSLLISTKAYTAKAKNIRRQPRVSIAIVDGPAHMVIYGSGEIVADDPLRADFTAQIFSRSPKPLPTDRTELIRLLDLQDRVVVVVQPESAAYQSGVS
jgi:Pyridoxamine 5'-phosphate oxidase